MIAPACDVPVTSVRVIQPPVGIVSNDNCQLASVITIFVVPLVVGAVRSVSSVAILTLPPEVIRIFSVSVGASGVPADV